MALRPATVILWPISVAGAGRGYNKAAPVWDGFIVFVVLNNFIYFVFYLDAFRFLPAKPCGLTTRSQGPTRKV